VKRRILSAILTVAALAVTLFGVPLAATLARLYRDSAIIELEREASATVPAVPEAVVEPGTPDPAKVPHLGPPATLALYRADGTRAGGQGPPSGGPLVGQALEGQVVDGVEDGLLVVAVPISDNEQVIGAVRATLPMTVVTHRIAQAWSAMAALAIGVLAVSSFVAGARARRLSQPIAGLADAANRLGHGDFTIRTSPVGVPEIDAAGVALNATAQRLGAILVRERQFSADASHQLRTQLAGLRLGLESALLDPDSNVTPHVELEHALVDVDRLEKTLEDLLALARDVPTDRGIIDVATLLDAVEATWHGPLAVQGRPLRTLHQDPLPPVRASTSAVTQILDVLVSNAATHGAGTVTVQVRALTGGIAFEVADEGAGPDQDEGYLFRRRSTHLGHGIGLAMARSLAEAEGARLQLRNPGPNPVFALLLPAAPE